MISSGAPRRGKALRALAAVSLICLGGVPPEENLRIAVVGQLVGPSRGFADDTYQATVMALERIRERRGMPGGKPEVKLFDDGCDLMLARQVAERIVRDFRPHAVIGHCPEVVDAVAPIYETTGTILFAPTSSTLPPPADYPGSHYVFRLGVRGDHMGRYAADYISRYWNESDEQPPPKVGIVRDGSPFGESVAATMARELEKGNRRILFDSVVNTPEELSELAAGDDPPVLFFATSEPQDVCRLIDDDLNPTGVVILGLPETADAAWSEFWRWKQGHPGIDSVDVLAPSPFGDGAHPDDVIVDVLRDIDRPTLTQAYALTAIDLLTQAAAEAGSLDPRLLQEALHGRPRDTLLGPVVSGVNGDIEPIPYRASRESYSWSPTEYYRGAFERLEPREGSERPVEYNVLVKPKKGTDPLVLKPDIVTEIRFSVGPPRPGSVVRGAEPSPILEALAKHEGVYLTVTLVSYLSEEGTFQQEHIWFDPVRGSSDTATFEIVPKASVVGGPGGLGELVFVVDGEGMEIDILKVHAFVGTPPAGAEAPPAAKVAMEPLDADEFSIPDLVISIAPSGGGAIPIALRPIDEGLRAELAQVLGGDDKQSLWTFKSSASQGDLDGVAGEIYKELRALVDQNDDRLQQIYEHQGTSLGLSPQASLLQFSDTDRDAMLELLHKHGEKLYWRLFGMNPRLEKAMAAIEAYADAREEAMQVRILSAKTYAPWQLLHPPSEGKVDPYGFWGFKYEIGTLQLVSRAQGRMRTAMKMPGHEDVIFAAWQSGDAKDTVAERAKLLWQALKKRFGDFLELHASRSDVETAFEERARSIKLLVVYGHASSGTQFVHYNAEDGSPHTVTLPAVEGPSLIFGDGDILTPARIDELHPKTRPYLFDAQPIVILNACETGSAGARAATDNGFVGAFTRSGARAIIVTEAPVWANFAYHFGSDLLKRILEGAEARTALRETRIRHYEKWKNPLGLLYTLYGNPAARIEKPN